MLAKTTAVVDTIDFKASGYKSKVYTISSYATHLEDVTLLKAPDDIQSVTLSSSLLKGKWACFFFDQDGCEENVTINNFTITNLTIVPSTDGVQFTGTWGTYDLAGGIVDQNNCIDAVSPG